MYATSSAQPWLAEAYSCANDLAIIIKMDANEPDIILRLGEPENILTPVYQIGEEEILVVVNNAIEVENISPTQARKVFTRGISSVQVWVFPSGEDIQQAFDQLALNGSRVVSTARVAPNVEQMSAALNSESNAVGILPKSALAGNVRAIYSVGVVPVLAITKEEPQGTLSALIACLQK